MTTTQVTKPGRRPGSKNRDKADPLYRRGNFGYHSDLPVRVSAKALEACSEFNKIRSERAFQEGLDHLAAIIPLLIQRYGKADISYKLRQKHVEVKRAAKFLENQIRKERRNILDPLHREMLLSLDFTFSGEPFSVSLATRGFPRKESKSNPF